MKRNILVLGSTGFIGRNIVKELLDNNYKLVVLVRDRKKSANIFYDFHNITYIEGDLKQSPLIERVLSEYKIDLVIHLVSNLIPSSSIADFNSEMREIVFPTFDLLELLSKLKIIIVYFSSGGTIYGNVNDLIDESQRLNPINYYGYTKLIIENHIRFLNRTQNLSYLILRPSNVYGRYQKIEAKQGFIAVALGKFISNHSLDIWGNGEIVRDFIDVQDVAEGLRKIIEADVINMAFNIGSGEGKSLNEVLSIISNSLQRTIKVTFKAKREVDLDRMILNVNKIKNYIDFNPKSLKTGINEFIKSIGLNEK